MRDSDYRRVSLRRQYPRVVVKRCGQVMCPGHALMRCDEVTLNRRRSEAFTQRFAQIIGLLVELRAVVADKRKVIGGVSAESSAACARMRMRSAAASSVALAAKRQYTTPTSSRSITERIVAASPRATASAARSRGWQHRQLLVHPRLHRCVHKVAGVPRREGGRIV